MYASVHIFHHAVFHTPAGYPPEALAVSNGYIVGKGTLFELLSLFPDAQLHDLKGGHVFPGFNDAHIHVWKVGSLQRHILDVRGISSRQQLLDALDVFGRNNPDSQWILARGFNEARWADTRLPTKGDLDCIFPDRPCQIMRTCAHVVVVNSRALSLANITRHTPDPPGGEIGRDPSGEPDGRLSERAMQLVAPHIPIPTTADYCQMILEAQEHLLRAGITSATDPEINEAQLEAYLRLEAEGQLKVRMNLFPTRPPAQLSGPRTWDGKSEKGMLQVDTIKFFADGGLSGKTAALSRPYTGDGGQGLLHLDYDTFLDRARRCQSAGWKIATHAIGDRAIEQVLDVYTALRAAPNSHLRHRIEHVGLPSAQQLQRMKQLDITVVSQPIFLVELGRNFRMYLDEAFQEIVYPYRQIQQAGISLAFSSDAPVVRDFNPLSGIRAAVQRCDDQGVPLNLPESIPAETAWKAYTCGGAWADGHEAFKGRLQPGQVADFVVFESNPLPAEGTTPVNTRVKEVWTGGRMVFRHIP